MKEFPENQLLSLFPVTDRPLDLLLIDKSGSNVINLQKFVTGFNWLPWRPPCACLPRWSTWLDSYLSINKLLIIKLSCGKCFCTFYQLFDLHMNKINNECPSYIKTLVGRWLCSTPSTQLSAWLVTRVCGRTCPGAEIIQSGLNLVDKSPCSASLITVTGVN